MRPQQLIATLKAKRYRIFERPGELNIVGVRSPSVIPNSFDDFICVFYRDEKHGWVFRQYPATTDPGTFWLREPGQPQGTGILAEGQYFDVYAIDLHRGKYPALCQRNGPVTVIRDYNRDAVLDFANGTHETGSFGINIHHASGEGITKTVDRYSAGCQVFANVEHFDEVMKLAEQHRARYGNKFTYTLIDQRAVTRTTRRRILGGLALGMVALAAVAVVFDHAQNENNENPI